MNVNEEFLDFVGLLVSHVNTQEKRIAILERALADMAETQYKMATYLQKAVETTKDYE